MLSLPGSGTDPSVGRGPTPGRPRWGAQVAVGAAWLALAMTVPPASGGAGNDHAPASPGAGAEADRLASRSRHSDVSARAGSERTVTDLAAAGPLDPVKVTGQPIPDALRAIADCQARFARVNDYVCTLRKRERINGTLTSPHVMTMKVRSRPFSVYLKFSAPNKGREAIYVADKNQGKVVAHDVGFFKVLAGTMHLDPKGEMAMDDCRHPITEAGIGSLIDTVAKHWKAELTPEESLVAFHPGLRINGRPCTMIESTHPSRQTNFLFHKVKLYIDHEHGLPVRFEAYDWPKRPGGEPELAEEYTYVDLRLNVGLGDRDFDPANKAYAFGRF